MRKTRSLSGHAAGAAGRSASWQPLQHVSSVRAAVRYADWQLAVGLWCTGTGARWTLNRQVSPEPEGDKINSDQKGCLVTSHSVMQIYACLYAYILPTHGNNFLSGMNPMTNIRTCTFHESAKLGNRWPTHWPTHGISVYSNNFLTVSWWLFCLSISLSGLDRYRWKSFP